MLPTTKRYQYISTEYPWCFIFFAALILCAHLIFQWLSNTQFEPIHSTIKQIDSWAVNLVFNQTYILLKLFGLNFYHDGNTFVTKAISGETGWMEITSGCTPLRAWFYWTFIILFFSGPWKQKLWYYPVGLIIIQIVNLLRIVSLGFVLTQSPTKYHTFHEIFGAIFYLVILIMWILWIEKLSRSPLHSNSSA